MIPVYVVVVAVAVVFVVVVEDHGKINFFLFEPPCCRRGGVTPHSKIIVGDEPPCIF